MKIAILGTRGIPNNYGGFEQFAEYVSVELVKRGHEVTVYNPHFHSYQASDFKGVRIISIYSPEKYIGASANFIYDWLCMRDALKRDFDIIYEAGYHSNAPSYFLLNRKSPIVITNMDGIEWKRSKWNWTTRKLIKYLEKLAIKRSDYLISDNKGIQQYYKEKYGVDSFFIAYGANPVTSYNDKVLAKYDVGLEAYFLLIARLEPENNIEMILDGYLQSESEFSFLVIGNTQCAYGEYLLDRFKKYKSIRFMGSIYNKEELDSLRCFSKAYFHGHSVGGTNPSLLEAMASNALIIANKNQFNKNVVNGNALYFSNTQECALAIRNIQNCSLEKIRDMKERNMHVILTEYSWTHIVNLHENLFHRLIDDRAKSANK